MNHFFKQRGYREKGTLKTERFVGRQILKNISEIWKKNPDFLDQKVENSYKAWVGVAAFGPKNENSYKAWVGVAAFGPCKQRGYRERGYS